jgi:hypothetical protein
MKTPQIERDRDRREQEMTERPKNQHAVALGQRNRGKTKTITPELAAAMRERLALRRLKRWINRKPKGAV